ncbi:proton-conducting transporter membrane subunit [Solidesulfovibrio sp.]|uniref:proton-conducting transporter transmembrane domain-containing protein n=1 Tax=Solidesulfovibrio sp. TaxID=2910990 RepID=UPI002B1F3FBF|nr:proton-conducting transporter membrane subunit [Solidesulfovibrio sp.]MEA4856193.1 proton-conducting transporter membrane subunit [Solidesulfovibrio sp.]
MLAALPLIPLTAALATLAIPADGPRRLVLIAAAGLHALGTAATFAWPPEPAWGGLLALDALGQLFLSLASLLFLAAAIYAAGYLRHEGSGPKRDFQDGAAFINAPERIFTMCLCLFLCAMTVVCATRNLSVLWVGVEATTLTSAPLIYFHRHRRSLEATWKYLVICSVGIALALLGNILFSVAFFDPSSPLASMDLAAMLPRAPGAAKPWLRAAFIFVLVGYGSKMGLAPMHHWLPDAHSQSPSLVSALLSGALLNCAFLGILRADQVLAGAGMADFGGELLVLFGLVSLATAAVFVVGQGDYKRLLAYSSVEHMGILALGVGIGGGAAFGAMLHAVNHSLTKGALFLLSGNILAVYHTRSCHDARGVARALPVTAALWLAGFLASCGSPPFGIFVSELTILKAMLAGGHAVAATLFLVLLAVIFVGMSVPVLRMVQGPLPPAVKRPGPESPLAVLPPLVLLAAVLVFGLYLPGPLTAFLTKAAQTLAVGG